MALRIHKKQLIRVAFCCGRMNTYTHTYTNTAFTLSVLPLLQKSLHHAQYLLPLLELHLLAVPP